MSAGLLSGYTHQHYNAIDYDDVEIYRYTKEPSVYEIWRDKISPEYTQNKIEKLLSYLNKPVEKRWTIYTKRGFILREPVNSALPIPWLKIYYKRVITKFNVELV